MKKNYVRRNFLKNSLMATGGLVLFPSISGFANIDKSAAKKTAQGSFCDIRNSIFGRQLQIKGQIFDTSGQHPVANALVEFWHLSPNSKQMGHRGTLRTDQNGNYNIKTDWPNRAQGKLAEIHFRVTSDTAQTETELKFSDFDAFISDKHWEKHNGLRESLLFPKMDKSGLTKTIQFNLSTNSLNF